MADDHEQQAAANILQCIIMTMYNYDFNCHDSFSILHIDNSTYCNDGHQFDFKSHPLSVAISIKIIYVILYTEKPISLKSGLYILMK